MSVAFYLTDDGTPATALAFGSTAAGATSATQTIHVWYNHGVPGGSVSNFSIEAVDPATDLASGVDWLDETWIEARINGGANPSNDPTFKTLTTDWYRLGLGGVLPAPDLPGNCAYYLELRLHPPLKDGTRTELVNFKLNPNYNESALALAGALSDLGSGIVTAVGDRTVTEWVEAPTALATGTPDAYVHVSKRWWVGAGVSLRTYAQDDLLLNQSDSASVALTTGHEYKALVSQPPSTGNGDVASVITKGLLSTTGTSVLPALPAGNILIATVLVAYHSSASVITQGNITVFAAGGRGKPTIGTGLNVNVCALRAVMPGARIINRSARVVAVPASLTSWIWLGSSDTFTVTQSATPPFAGALPIAKAVAGASTITTLTDLRTYFEPNVRVVSLHRQGGEPRFFGSIRVSRASVAIANAAYTDFTTEHGDIQVLAVAGVWKVQPTGSTTADVGVAGTTQRYDAAGSTVAGSTFNGLIAGLLYYPSAPVIRVTPNAISAANGVLELTVLYIDLRQSSAAYIDSFAIGKHWNLDRMIASFNTGGGGTGTTTFDVKRLGDGTSLCAAGAQPTIASPAALNATASGWPSITVGAPDTFGLYLSAVADPANFYYNFDLQVDLMIYPLEIAS